ncbi:MAG: helix-turn-helix domain-containing protein [Treponemataceae bacterium]
MDIINRLILIRKTLKLNQIQFGEKLGMTNSAISSIEKGKTPLIEKNIKMICSLFNVDENWLKNGTGEMFSEKSINDELLSELYENFKKLTPAAKRIAIDYIKRIIEDQKTLRAEIEQSENDDTKKGAC